MTEAGKLEKIAHDWILKKIAEEILMIRLHNKSLQQTRLNRAAELKR